KAPSPLLVLLADCIAAAVEAGDAGTAWSLQVGVGFLGLAFLELAKLLIAFSRRCLVQLCRLLRTLGPAARASDEEPISSLEQRAAKPSALLDQEIDLAE
ncbi:unnamed protein product, partial [Prorocentrum cordatum]